MINKISVDVEKNIGSIKPMHCINNIPNIVSDDVLGAFKDAGIPFCRLHDTFLCSMDKFVDIPKIFPDFDADENDENSYDFAFTDYLMSYLAKFNIKPFYRLGTSIENFHNIKSYFIYPPKNNLKWAKICEHVIMHYNEGWANGFKYNIEYWEIWNEPDNFPDIKDNQMWKGTKEQFFELYQVSASYLKERFPKLKIGGYGSCGFYAVGNKFFNANANSSPRVEYFIDFFKEFLSYISDEKHPAPLDFFSWHSYSNVKRNTIYADYCRKTLDEYGFTKTEQILNEWNPGINDKGTLKDSSNILSNMIALQNTSLDMLMYYDCRERGTYCGLINPLTVRFPVDVKQKLYKAYYVFKAWNEVYKLNKQVLVECNVDDIYAVAGYNNGEGCLLVSNNSDQSVSICIDDLVIKSIMLISQEKDLENTDITQNLELNAYETVLIYF